MFGLGLATKIYLAIDAIDMRKGIPLYLQLIEQVKHAVETGALREGDQIPTIRKVAVDLVMNPNTVVRAYRELEHEGVIELKHGSGAFIKETVGARARVMRKAQAVLARDKRRSSEPSQAPWAAIVERTATYRE